MCLASSFQSDSLSASDILAIMEAILAANDQYLIDLDSLQTLNNGNTSSFIPDANSITKINDIVNLTISNLFNISLNAKQERSIITEEDTNIILLTHRLYGIDSNDKNIDELISENNIGLTETLQIKKGRKILYYI